MKINPLYEDNHIIVVSKSSGILSQGDFSKQKSLIDFIKIYLKDKYKKPGNVFLGLVHRLDKEVSGCMVFAKTSKAASRLSKEIRNKNFYKFYISINENHPGNKISNDWIKVENFIVRKRDISICMNKEIPGSKQSILYYKNLWNSDKYSFNLIFLETGRKHQIRATFSYINHPIIGDVKYGSNTKFFNNSIALHSYALLFKHPVKEELIKSFNLNSFWVAILFETIFNSGDIEAEWDIASKISSSLFSKYSVAKLLIFPGMWFIIFFLKLVNYKIYVYFMILIELFFSKGNAKWVKLKTYF